MDALEEPFEVFRIDSRCDSVPKIRNPSLRLSANFESRAHTLDFSLDRFLAPIQHVGIHVTLECNFVTHELTGFHRIDAPINSEYVISSLCREEFESIVGAFSEEGHRDDCDVSSGEFLAYSSGNTVQSGERELLEMVGCQFSRPRIEDLQQLYRILSSIVIQELWMLAYLCASLYLPYEKIDADVCNAVQKSF